MKLPKNLLIIITLLIIVIAGFVAIKTYLSLDPLPSVSTTSQQIKDVETDIDQDVINKLKITID